MAGETWIRKEQSDGIAIATRSVNRVTEMSESRRDIKKRPDLQVVRGRGTWIRKEQGDGIAIATRSVNRVTEVSESRRDIKKTT